MKTLRITEKVGRYRYAKLGDISAESPELANLYLEVLAKFMLGNLELQEVASIFSYSEDEAHEALTWKATELNWPDGDLRKHN